MASMPWDLWGRLRFGPVGAPATNEKVLSHNSASSGTGDEEGGVVHRGVLQHARGTWTPVGIISITLPSPSITISIFRNNSLDKHWLRGFLPPYTLSTGYSSLGRQGSEPYPSMAQSQISRTASGLYSHFVPLKAHSPSLEPLSVLRRFHIPSAKHLKDVKSGCRLEGVYLLLRIIDTKDVPEQYALHLTVEDQASTEASVVVYYQPRGPRTKGLGPIPPPCELFPRVIIIKEAVIFPPASRRDRVSIHVAHWVSDILWIDIHDKAIPKRWQPETIPRANQARFWKAKAKPITQFPPEFVKRLPMQACQVAIMTHVSTPTPWFRTGVLTCGQSQ